MNKETRLLLGVLLLFLFFQCGNFTNSNSEQTSDSTKTPNSTEKPNQHTEKSLEDYPEFQPNGKVVQKLEWEKNGKKHFAIFSKGESGSFFNPDWRSELYIYHFSLINSELKLLASNSHKNPNMFTELGFFDTLNEVIELSENEDRAISYTFYICPDGEDPCEIKTVLIVEDQTFELSRMENEEDADAYSKEVPIAWNRVMEQKLGAAKKD